MAATIRINRAPVLTLWAAVVAERLGFDRDTALTLGQAVAGLSAHAKGVSLGIIEPSPDLVRERGRELGEGEQLYVGLLGRAVPVKQTPDGLRAVSKGKPGNPAQIEKYLAGKFGADLEVARAAMVELAASVEPADLQRRGFRLYERFRPDVPAGESGWGAKGELDLAKVRGRAGPFGMLAVVVRLRHLATVFGLSPKRAAKAAGRLLRRQELGPNARRRAC